MKKIILILVFSLFFITNSYAQYLEAEVNRNNLPVGEVVILNINLNGAVKSDISPDISALYKDFKVHSVSNSYNSINNNGVVSRQQQWQVAMTPMKSGQLTIPSFKLGDLSSQPLLINVSGDVDVKYSIKGEVDNMEPYVQQQVNYVVTIIDKGGLQGGEPQFMDNGQNEWIVRMLKNPVIENKMVDGNNVREIRLYYALFPQKSGKLAVPALHFNGYRNSDRAPTVRNIFGGTLTISGGFANREPVFLTPDTIEVNVMPIPHKKQGKWWIPAKNVELSSQFSEESPKFRVGEALSRKITLKATGVLEKQLPDLKFLQAEGIKQYPEKPMANNVVVGNDVVSIKEVTVVYIPNKSGKTELPEIGVDWFNVNTGLSERAVLPAIKIEVLGGGENSYEEAVAEEKTASHSFDSESEAPVKRSKDYMVYVVAGLTFLLGVGLGCLLFMTKNRVRKKNYKKDVVSAAKERNLKALCDELIKWGQNKYANPNINNLKELGEFSGSKEFAQKLNKLNIILYSGKNVAFDENQFIDIFTKVDKKKTSKSKKEKLLPDLYE